MTPLQRIPLFLVLAALACTPTGGPDPAPAPSVPEAPSEPALAEGRLTAADEIAAQGFLEAATAAAAIGDWPEAARTARQVVEQFPSLPGSFRALRILASAAYETGDFAAARESAERVLAFPEEGEWVEGTRLILGRSALAQGDTLAAMGELMRISPEASEDVVAQALEEVRPVVSVLGANELSGLLADAGLPGPVFPPFQVEYGVALYFQGASEEAADLGRAALAAGAVNPEEELARALVSGRVEDALGGERTIGALLPSSGPPTLTRFGTLLEEGVRIALEEQRTLDRRPVQVLIEDDGGSVATLESLVPDLESRGVSALIGPLLDDAVAAAGTLRQREFPIVSPTARDIPPGMRGVYSLMGPDPSGPRALADWAARNGIGRVVIMHPTEPASSFESQVFRDQFTQSGGQVLEELLFPVGATFFEEFLRQVEELAPDALVLPLQAPAIELVAPQVTFYGLDTLGIQILGTDAWTSDAVLQTIDPRHTNGVIASTTLPGGLPGPAARRFRERYEEIHRQTLRSEVPALGYDAAGILLEGIRAGASSGEDLLAFLETLDGFEGATGRLSVEDGRLVRSHYLVRLENRTMLPVF
jgi:branched-chain amino acid transport system substrate-binding protein